MLEIMKKAAREAGKIQMKYFRQAELDVARKTDHQNIVTVADKESQDTIQNIIIEELGKKEIETKEIGFIGEEDLNAEGSHVFVIDPIDGTSNFASGIDYFCSSIAYFHEGTLTAGVIYRPTHDELFYAENGKGAFLEKDMRNEKLEMRNVSSADQILTFNIGNTLVSDSHTQAVEKLLPSYRGARSFGAVALDFARLAANETGTTVDDGPYIWDIAAGKLIIDEAGGVLFDFRGNPIQPNLKDRYTRYQIVGCHPSLKKIILETIVHSH